MRHDILERLDFSGFLSPELTESKTTSLTLKPHYFFLELQTQFILFEGLPSRWRFVSVVVGQTSNNADWTNK